jgi:hypothetical protein
MAVHAVRIGSREITIDQSPLPTSFLQGHGPVSVSRPRADCLVIANHGLARFIGWCCGVFGWLVLALGVLTLFEHVAGLLLVLWGGAMFFIWVRGVWPRYRFDAGDAHLTVSHVGRTRRRPLGDIVAVQVIDGGKFKGRRGRVFTCYQMNLILDDAQEPRLFVSYNDVLAELESTAKLVADFLNVPLVALTQSADREPAASPPVSAAPPSGRSDPTRYWTKTDEPLPLFDLEAGALGPLALGSSLAAAEFLGRPDRVEHLERPGSMVLHYIKRGFRLGFMPDFAEFICTIAPTPGRPPEYGQGFSRPRLSGDIELTAATSVADIRELFGPPTSEHEYAQDKILVLVYDCGRFHMEFEFDPSTGRLLTWSVPV